MGITQCAEFVLASRRLHVKHISAFAWDWFRCLREGAVFKYEVDMFFEAIGLDMVTVLGEYLRRWVWPRGYGDAKDVAQPLSIKGKAIEWLTLI